MIIQGKETRQMRLNKKWRLLLLFSMFFWVTGCWDKRESEHVLFINFTNMAKQEGPANRNYSPTYVGKGEGKLLYDAAFNFYKSSQQKISWEHIKSVVVTERFLKHGNLNQLNDFFLVFFSFET